MSPAPLPPWEVLDAPPNWRIVEFISDLHLHEDDAATFAAWERYLRDTPADAVFILGDLFDAWVGDDAALAPGFEQRCEAVLRATTGQRAVFVMHGNRDFLLADEFALRTRVTLLDDPTLLRFAGHAMLLTHGDLLCVSDTAYQAARREWRSPQWQTVTLAQPLPARRALARRMREQSREHHAAAGMALGVVDEPSAIGWLDEVEAPWLIHGHTHRPAEHALGGDRRRVVLSDWDANARPPRLEALRADAQGLRRIPLS